MSTQDFFFLHAFRTFSRKCKSQLLQSCRKRFIRFLSECSVNILKGTLQSVERHHLFRYERDSQLLSERGLQLVDTNTPMSLITCLDMEQFVFVPASLLNKLNTTKSTTLKVDRPNTNLNKLLRPKLIR